MHFETSPGSSPSKSIPITIRAMSSSSSSSSSSLYSTFSSTSTSSSQGSTCAYPSWPSGNSLEYRSSPSSYISDADLFGEDFDEEFGTPYLQEAPAPPRMPVMAQQFPLPPLYVQEKPKKTQQRRSSGRKQRRTSKPMTPIAESVEATE